VSFSPTHNPKLMYVPLAAIDSFAANVHIRSSSSARLSVPMTSRFITSDASTRRGASPRPTSYLKWVESSRQWRRNTTIGSVQVQPRLQALPATSGWLLHRRRYHRGIPFHTVTTSRPNPLLRPPSLQRLNNTTKAAHRQLSHRVFINLQLKSTQSSAPSFIYHNASRDATDCGRHPVEKVAKDGDRFRRLASPANSLSTNNCANLSTRTKRKVRFKTAPPNDKKRILTYNKAKFAVASNINKQCTKRQMPHTNTMQRDSVMNDLIEGSLHIILN
jgi:hypothetical protein